MMNIFTPSGTLVMVLMRAGNKDFIANHVKVREGGIYA